MSEVLSYEVREGVGTIVLNRPDAMNALDRALKVALRDVLEAAADDSAVRAVLFTGAGRAFCVGQDLKEHVSDLAQDVAAAVEHRVEAAQPDRAGHRDHAEARRRSVNGPAAGAGASLAFACDFRFMADTASYTLAFAGIGLTADTGASWTLPRLVGSAKAAELLMLPGGVRAAEALALGLSTRVLHPTPLSRPPRSSRSGWRPARRWRTRRSSGAWRTPPPTTCPRRWHSRTRGSAKRVPARTIGRPSLVPRQGNACLQRALTGLSGSFFRSVRTKHPAR